MKYSISLKDFIQMSDIFQSGFVVLQEYNKVIQTVQYLRFNTQRLQLAFSSRGCVGNRSDDLSIDDKINDRVT